MSAPIEKTTERSMDDCCEIEATVTTGLEPTALEEAVEKLNADVTITRGRIIMKVPMKKVLELGCVDNCYVLMTKEKDFPFSDDELESMRKLRELVKRVDWETGLRAWREVFSFKNHIPHKPDVIPDVLGQPELSSRIHKPKKGDNGGKKSRRQKRQEKKEKRLEERKKRQEQNHENNENHSCTETENLEQKSNHNSFQEHECSEHSEESKDIVDKDPKTLSNDLSKRLGNEEYESQRKSENLNDSSASKTDAISEPVNKKPKLTEYNPEKPSFRVTCHRTGEGHSFDSMGAQSNFGGAVYNYFKWNVSMKEFDFEVMLYIDGSDVKVGLALTKHSLHRRNTTAFGPTTLRPTIAYNMLRMCKIKPYEIVCDPMCGSGVIPIQAAVDWPESIHIAGEIVHRGLNRTLENIDFVNKEQTDKEKPKINVHAIRWDACNLPFKDDTVDVFITDLPFGIRLGSKAENSTLYPRALYEMSRVAKRKTGRVCLLTQDKKGINKAMQMVSKYWKRTNAVGINMGGLAACVYMMYRNMEVFDKSQPLVFPKEDTSPFKGSTKSCIPKDEGQFYKQEDLKESSEH